MTWIDWGIVIVAVIVLRSVSASTRKYMRGVTDFLAANRLAGRYMLTIGMQMGGTGVIAIIGLFEMHYTAGFTPVWWALMALPVGVILPLTGFVYYRYRQTRALTLAQFFEMRYGRKFRIFAGIVCFLTGIINFGVFPAVAARFFVYFAGFPEQFSIPGIPFSFSTFAVVMFVDLALALFFVLMGGQISVMVTECFQGILCSLAFVVIAAVVMLKVGWPQMLEAMQAAPANASMIHPFKGGQIKDFNVWYYAIGILSWIYTMAAWQGHQAYNASARSPHEQKMGQIIGGWRWGVQGWMGMVLAMGMFTVLTHPNFAHIAASVNAQLAGIENPTVQGQMRVPLALAQILPVGIKGLLLTVMLFLSFTNHDTYMHSWGSIFIQDVYMPIRNKILSAEEHIRLLRWSIVGVAIYAFLFGIFYSPSTPVFMYWAITGTIWLPGAGAAVIGGLYWKRGTTIAAYPAIGFGILIGLFGLIYPPIYQRLHHSEFPINNQYLFFMAMVGSALIYVLLSLLTSKGREFNLDKMLHRGPWAVEKREAHEELRVTLWQRMVGINKEFSITDRILAIALVVWNAAWVVLFGVVTLLNLIRPFDDLWWARFWHGYMWAFLVINSVIVVWFAIGGAYDIRMLLRRLATATRDDTDDGRVLHETQTPRANAALANR
jgi:SSS family solute:Na+ symporter